jgi:predicted RNA binding protein YcfA (HicA-like mRNA interferase family)
MIKRQSGGSHKVLARPGWQDFVFAFHDGTEIGPVMLARIARHTGLSKKDL